MPMAVTAADTIKRTITGTIVTWNEQGNTSVGPTIFAADSIEIKPVKLLLEHDRTRPIGKMIVRRGHFTKELINFISKYDGTAKENILESGKE